MGLQMTLEMLQSRCICISKSGNTKMASALLQRKLQALQYKLAAQFDPSSSLPVLVECFRPLSHALDFSCIVCGIIYMCIF